MTEIIVVGAGVFGLAVALRLAQAGAGVRLFDCASSRPNASAVAAGMLAPVSETLAEGGDRQHLDRLLLARDLWPDFARSVPGLFIDRIGTDLLMADEADREAIIAQLATWGIESPRLPSPRLGVHLVDDWRLDPLAAIAAMRAALKAFGVAVETGAVEARPPRPGAAFDLLAAGEPLCAEAVVVAGGYDARLLQPIAPELAALTPIKGQLLVFGPGAPGGPAVRGEAFYLAPQPSGARFGATMQPGCDDLAVDLAVAARQRAAAVALKPDLADLACRGEAGVRAGTADGWPLVGPSVTPGVFLASGARRNGWLLAPLISQLILDEVTGGAAHPLAQAFHPGRFSR